MGTWGAAIFSDDFAADIKTEYLALLQYGDSEEEAYTLTKDYFLKDSIGSDDEPVFWLSIASIQYKHGILLPEVKEKALAIIQSGADLARWEGKERKKREAVLLKLQEQILSPLPPKKKARVKVYKSPWKIGDLVAFQYTSWEKHWFNNKYILTRVVYIRKNNISHIKADLVFDEWPQVATYNWIGDSVPNPEMANHLDCFRPPMVWKRSDKADAKPSDPNKLYVSGIEKIPHLHETTTLLHDSDFCLPHSDTEYYSQTRHILWKYSDHFKALYEKGKTEG